MQTSCVSTWTDARHCTQSRECDQRLSLAEGKVHVCSGHRRTEAITPSRSRSYQSSSRRLVLPAQPCVCGCPGPGTQPCILARSPCACCLRAGSRARPGCFSTLAGGCLGQGNRVPSCISHVIVCEAVQVQAAEPLPWCLIVPAKAPEPPLWPLHVVSRRRL